MSIFLTRRDWLRNAGLFAAALPMRTARAAESVSPAMSRLSSYMADAQNREIPAAIVETAKHHILDTFAAMISGTELQPGQIALRFARAHVGEQTATVAGSNIVCSPIDAALANGILAHSDETDDYAPLGTHPGAAVVPAALAVGEQFGVSGMHFLRAVTLGYDVANRFGIALGGLTLNYDHHLSIHTITGTFSAAAAAGSAASLNAQQMRWVMDYASQQAAGIAAWQRDTEHIEKALVYSGFPARNGVTAALLVQLGGTGVDDVFSGADNFLLAFAPKTDPSKLIEELGERYEITRTTIKKWSVGGPIQAPLDAMEILFKRRPFDAEQVKQVIVRVGPGSGSIVDNREMPDVCLQHMVAVMLLDKTASFKAAHDKSRMQDPAVLRQRAKVRLVPDPELERTPQQREAIVEITLVDGTELKERIAAVRGTIENPMTREDISAKARDLTASVLGTAKSTKLIETVLNLENVKNVRELRPLLQPA